MSAIGSATINAAAVASGVFPSGTPAAQPPIGYNKLTSANVEMWNGQIGTREDQGEVNALGPNYIADKGTIGYDEDGALMTWCLCVLGCAAGATGTITAGEFVDDSGTSVAKADIAANGYGWVLN